MTQPPNPRDSQPRNPQIETRDLGFGSRVGQELRRRFLNRDGTFNVARVGLPWHRSHTIFQVMLTTSWPRFFLLVGLGYLILNSFFAIAFFVCGPGSLAGSDPVSPAHRLMDCFFFSIQTFATIGYGGMTPKGIAANVLVTMEAFIGLFTVALATGLMFARFSRPTAQIVFSDKAIIAPYRGITAFEFRIINALESQLLDVKARVIFSRLEMKDGVRKRLWDELPLEREGVLVFPLHWVIVHPIDEASPLRGYNAARLREASAEFIVFLTAVDETFFQQVMARSSYASDEIEIGARFTDMFQVGTDGRVMADVRRLSEIEPAELPD